MKTEKEKSEQLARLSASKTIYEDIVAKIDNNYSLAQIKSHSLLMLKAFEVQHKILNEETRKDSVIKCDHPFTDRFINNDKAWCNKCKCWVE